MSAQRLGDRKTRQLAAKTGLPIVRAWAHGGMHQQEFVIPGPPHRHGLFDPHDGSVKWDDDPGHFSTCAAMFPQG